MLCSELYFLRSECKNDGANAANFYYYIVHTTTEVAMVGPLDLHNSTGQKRTQQQWLDWLGCWLTAHFFFNGREGLCCSVSSHFDTRVTPPKQELWLWRISTRDSSFHAKPILTRTKYLMYYQYGLQPNNKFTFIGFFQFIVYWQ